MLFQGPSPAFLALLQNPNPPPPRLDAQGQAILRALPQAEGQESPANGQLNNWDAHLPREVK